MLHRQYFDQFQMDQPIKEAITLHLAQGFDSSYYIQTKVSVRRGIIWGIDVRSIDKGEVLIFFFEINCFEAKVDIQKGALRFRMLLTIDVLVSSNSYLHPLLPHGNKPTWLLCSLLLGFPLGF